MGDGRTVECSVHVDGAQAQERSSLFQIDALVPGDDAVLEGESNVDQLILLMLGEHTVQQSPLECLEIGLDACNGRAGHARENPVQSAIGTEPR